MIENNYQCKFGSIDDLDSINDLLESCNSQQKKLIPSTRTYTYYRDLFLNVNEHKKYVVVAYKENKINVLQEFILREQILSWHLNMLIIRPVSTYFNCQSNGLNDLYTFCFEFVESKGYYQYDWSQKAGKKYENRFSRMKSQITILQKYDHYDIGYVEENSLSTYPGYAVMNNNEKKPYTTLIRTGILKNEFRKKLNLAIRH
jgi:hypothetical protein